ncbi:MAG: dihydroorotate dehydrogenase, partial [Nitrososphaerota archaeon]|nr:dihydroorotate dehydrogenase [Nitrososphaerota archaeon]
MTPDLSVSIGPISLGRPAMLASGILGISLDVFGRIYRSGAGAVVSKSLSKEPWDGYPNPTIVGIKGGYLNAVGLSNPGAPYFAKMISQNKDVPIIVSLVGSIEDEFEFMVNQFENSNVTAYELNLSCPHVEKVGLEVGDDPRLVTKIVSRVKSTTKAPVIAKVGLGTTNYLDT